MAADQTSTRNEDDDTPEETLLAIDLGLRTGLAVYDEARGLVAYHSQRFANRSQLKRAAWGVLRGRAGGLGACGVPTLGGGREIAREGERLIEGERER